MASTYELLNVHTEPNRLSPSFLQIKEGEKVDVVAHVSLRATPPERKSLIPPKPKTLPPARKHAESKISAAAVAAPAASAVRTGWSFPGRLPRCSRRSPRRAEAANAPCRRTTGAWCATPQGESGWVLTRRLYMAIPDDVAQYAEGHRITSYFALGEVPDGEQVKHNWLWTTIGGGDHPYDFDSFRVFIWSLRRHRYETAYIQRNMEGYFPVLANPAGFSVCVTNAAGQRVRRSYSFQINAVRFTGEQPCKKLGSLLPGVEVAGHKAASPAPAPSGPKPSLYTRLKALVGRWFAR